MLHAIEKAIRPLFAGWVTFAFSVCLKLLTPVAEKTLMCSDHEFLVSIKEPTYYCLIQGMTILY